MNGEEELSVAKIYSSNGIYTQGGPSNLGAKGNAPFGMLSVRNWNGSHWPAS